MARVFQIGKTWYLDYRSNGQRIRQRVGDNKKLAQDALAMVTSKIVRNEFGIPVEKKIKFSEFAEEFLKTVENKKSYVSMYKNQVEFLKQFFGEKYLHQIRQKDVEEFQRTRVAVSEITANRSISVLKIMLNRAVDWEYIGVNPARKVKLYREKSRINYLTKDQYHRLLEHSDPKLSALITVAVNTGLRKSELKRLRFKDVDFALKLIIIKEQKNGEVGYQPMNESVANSLLRLKTEALNDIVFDFDFRKAFNKATKAAGMPELRFHDLRHTFASWLALAGVDIHTIMKLMRHKTIAMTLRYAHLSPNHMQSAVNCIGQENSGQKDGNLGKSEEEKISCN